MDGRVGAIEMLWGQTCLLHAYQSLRWIASDGSRRAGDEGEQ